MITFQPNQEGFWRIQTLQEAIGQYFLPSAFYFFTIKDKELAGPYAQQANLFLNYLCEIMAFNQVPSSKDKFYLL